MLNAAGFRTRTFEHTVRRITWQDAQGMLDLAGADVVARYGVLCVNHLVTDDERKHDPQFFADLARLELTLADRDPYRDIAAMWMLVARRR
jgi:S-adenosylmethionine-dependent methyltransferase